MVGGIFQPGPKWWTHITNWLREGHYHIEPLLKLEVKIKVSICFLWSLNIFKAICLWCYVPKLSQCSFTPSLMLSGALQGVLCRSANQKWGLDKAVKQLIPFFFFFFPGLQLPAVDIIPQLWVSKFAAHTVRLVFALNVTYETTSMITCDASNKDKATRWNSSIRKG